MKAWLVREKDEFCATVVFAETRNKARVMALSTDCCEDAAYCNIEARRQPQMDKYYVDGKKEMDWETPQDRIALVKDCSFVCDRDCWEREDCDVCPASEYCYQYQDYIESEKTDGGERE